MKLTLLFLTFFGAVRLSQASIVISTDGTNAANLQSISIDGTVYSGSDLIGVDVTAFSMFIPPPNSAADPHTFQIVPTGAGASTGAAATGLMEDSSLTTGYAGLSSVSFDFLSPVTNRPGVDLFIFEYNPNELSTVLNVTLNSTTLNIASGGNPFTTITGLTVDADLEWNEDTAATSIAILEGLSFVYNQTQTGSPIGYHAIDLSDYGVASGATVSDITLAGTNDWDITGVVAVIPEPSTFGLMLIGLAAGLVLTGARSKKKRG